MSVSAGACQDRVQLVNVSKMKLNLVGGAIEEVPVLSDVSASVRRGELVLLLGPSGSGKSTLLRHINRLESPDSGRILLDGQDICSLPLTELRRRVGMVFQVPALFPGSVSDNIAFGPGLQGPHRTGRCPEDLAVLQLERVGLARDLGSRAAETLSVGQQQRVSIARALANDPEVLLMDEPTSALDPSASSMVLSLVRELNASLGLTIILVTHSLDHARSIGGRVLLLVGGRIAEDSGAADFFAGPATELGRSYLMGDSE